MLDTKDVPVFSISRSDIATFCAVAALAVSLIIGLYVFQAPPRSQAPASFPAQPKSTCPCGAYCRCLKTGGLPPTGATIRGSQ